MDEIVTFDVAEMLCKLYRFSGKTHAFYWVESRELVSGKETMKYDAIDHNRNRIWNGQGWSYSRYSAPTYIEVANWACTMIDECNKALGEKNKRISELEAEVKRLKGELPKSTVDVNQDR